MPTRLTWTKGSALIIVLAGASVAWAEPAGSDQNSALAPFLSGPACEVPSLDSGQHLGWVRTRNQGLIGGSYGEVFFASGAGTRAVTTATGTGSSGGSSSTTTPGVTTPGGSGGGSGSGSATSPTVGRTRGESGDDGGDHSVDDRDKGHGSRSTGTGPTSGPEPGDPPGGGGGGGDRPAVNPEPATLILLGTGLMGVLFTERRRRSKK